jgi:Coenzyme PQQ synthesis protein D (PqqD)
VQYRRADDMTWDTADERAVILDPHGATMITLNPVGTLLWLELDTPRDVDGLTAALCERFPEVAPDQLREDVEDFVGSLRDEGLLVDVDVDAGTT